MNKFEKAYQLINDDLSCPKNCNICEKGALQYLPEEVAFLAKRTKVRKEKLANIYKINGHLVWTIMSNDKHCPFYKSGRCMNRDARPLDCRSYPAIPYLKRGELDVKLDEKCPLVKKNIIPEGFLNRARDAWKIANPPSWWLKIYEGKMK